MYLKPKFILINVIFVCVSIIKTTSFHSSVLLVVCRYYSSSFWLFYFFLKICKIPCNFGFIRLSSGMHRPSSILHRSWCAILISLAWKISYIVHTTSVLSLSFYPSGLLIIHTRCAYSLTYFLIWFLSFRTYFCVGQVFHSLDLPGDEFKYRQRSFFPAEFF